MKAHYVSFRALSRALFLALIGIASICHADVVADADPLADARQAYSQRSAQAIAQLSAAERALGAATVKITDNGQRYDALILESRMFYFIGMHTEDASQKKDIFLEGRKAADAAEAIDGQFTESAYFAAINVGRWGEANGIFASLKSVPILKAYLNAAMSRKTRDGKPGDTIDGAGPHRLLGRLYDKLPGIFGGSRTKALEELRKATAMAPDHALNTVYLASTLLEGNDADKAEARQKLEALLKTDPKLLNPEAIPETEDDFKLARLLLAGKDI